MPSTALTREQLLLTTPAGLAILHGNGKYQYARHTQALNRALLNLASGKHKRLMVFMPPRSGKSELCSATFPAWYLATHPEHRVILASYEATFAAEWGRKARDIVNEYGPLYGVAVSQDSSAADHWNIAKHRGGMDTAGIGGPLTGRGADLLIIDDPVKNYEEAQSETLRQRAWDWFTSTAYTRLSPHGKILLVMTRWHEDDLAGRLLKQGGWEVLSLPAIAEEDDAMGRLPGEPLWPERWPLEALEQIKATQGARQFAALYQQRPTPASGAIFRREWCTQRYRELPQLSRTVMAIDGAWGGNGSDYSAVVIAGTDGRNYYLIHVYRDRLAYPDLKRVVIDLYNRYRPQVVVTENAASGIAIVQELKRTTNLPIVPITAKGSKQVRAESVSPLWEAHKVYLPSDAPWVEDFIEEIVTFPASPHDDQADAMVYALMRLSSRGEVSSMPSILDMEALPIIANIWDAEPDIALWG